MSHPVGRTIDEVRMVHFRESIVTTDLAFSSYTYRILCVDATVEREGNSYCEGQDEHLQEKALYLRIIFYQQLRHTYRYKKSCSHQQYAQELFMGLFQISKLLMYTPYKVHIELDRAIEAFLIFRAQSCVLTNVGTTVNLTIVYLIHGSPLCPTDGEDLLKGIIDFVCSTHQYATIIVEHASISLLRDHHDDIENYVQQSYVA